MFYEAKGRKEKLARLSTVARDYWSID